MMMMMSLKKYYSLTIVVYWLEVRAREKMRKIKGDKEYSGIAYY